MSLKPLPLRKTTPLSWAQEALQQPLALLSDQAYLEKKAANNALEFLNLWPGPRPPAHWLSSVAAIARDETQHLQLVLRLLEKRKGTLAPRHQNPYAADLRKWVRQGKGRLELADRLLVSALIEARSCERFMRLAEVSWDAELSKFYAGLVASENGHYQMFVDMAKKALPAQEVQERWELFLEKEAGLIQSQPRGPRVHSGWAG